jgi:hypothetical protein
MTRLTSRSDGRGEPLSALIAAWAAGNPKIRRVWLFASPGGSIVSLDDLLDAVAHDVAELAHIGRAGLEREAAERTPLPPEQPPQAVHIPAYSFV